MHLIDHLRQTSWWVLGSVVFVMLVATSLATTLFLSYPYADDISTSGQIQMTGIITCLPHKPGPDGISTLECAFGLKNDNNEYYGLTGLDQDKLISGKITDGHKITVKGQLVPNGLSHTYDIKGTIQVEELDE